jgi:N-acetylneuraminic acid mutarotase
MTLRVTEQSTSLFTDINSLTVGNPSSLVLALGNNEVATVNTRTGNDPTVIVNDNQGQPVPGVTIDWAITASNGSPVAAQTVTDSVGVTSNGWTLGTTAGTNSDVLHVSESSSGAFNDFIASATPDAPTQIIKTAGDGQTAAAGSTLPTTLVVHAADQYGNATPNVDVTFGAGQGGSANPTNALTDGNGYASTTWTVGLSAGTQTLDASLTNNLSVTTQFSATVTAAFVARASMPAVRNSMTAADANGLIYVVGGSGGFPTTYADGLVYDPNADSWSAIATSGVARSWTSTNNAVIRDSLYLINGNPNSTCTNESEAYEIAGNSWSAIATSPRTRCHSAAIAYNGQVWTMGGWDASSTFRYLEVDMYDPSTNSWSTPTTMPDWRGSFAAAVYNGVLYLFGGTTSAGNCNNSVVAYDFAGNSWSTVASLPTARCDAAAVVVGSRIFVLGGDDGAGNYVATVESYDPVGNSWQAETSMNTARANSGAAYVNGILYMIGGANSSGLLSTVEAIAIP